MPKYVTANANSKMGDPNYADKSGYVLVGVHHCGHMIYRRKWWRRAVNFMTWEAPRVEVTNKCPQGGNDE